MNLLSTIFLKSFLCSIAFPVICFESTITKINHCHEFDIYNVKEVGQIKIDDKFRQYLHDKHQRQIMSGITIRAEIKNYIFANISSQLYRNTWHLILEMIDAGECHEDTLVSIDDILHVKI